MHDYGLTNYRNMIAASIKALRKREAKLKRDARKSRSNSNVIGLARELTHNERVNILRPAARAAHLLNAYIRDVPYRVVEQSTREGNEPCLVDVYTLGISQGYEIDHEHLIEWAK